MKVYPIDLKNITRNAAKRMLAAAMTTLVLTTASVIPAQAASTLTFATAVNYAAGSYPSLWP